MTSVSNNWDTPALLIFLRVRSIMTTTSGSAQSFYLPTPENRSKSHIMCGQTYGLVLHKFVSFVNRFRRFASKARKLPNVTPTQIDASDHGALLKGVLVYFEHSFFVNERFFQKSTRHIHTSFGRLDVVVTYVVSVSFKVGIAFLFRRLWQASGFAVGLGSACHVVSLALRVSWNVVSCSVPYCTLACSPVGAIVMRVENSFTFVLD